MRPLALATLTLAVLAPSAVAGPPEFPRLRGLFDRKKKDEPAAPNRAKQLLDTLRADTDERKRKSAAEDLADFDPRGNADITAGLIASLRQDPAVAVRTAAAESLSKLKPVSAQAGVALEESVQSDPADGVRKAAQAALFQYHLNGYKGSPAGTVQSVEPPLAKAKAKSPAAPPTRPTPVPSAVPVGRGTITPAQTAEPPLAKPKTALPTAEPTVIPPAAETPGVPTIPTVMPPTPNPTPGIPKIPTPSGKPKG